MVGIETLAEVSFEALRASLLNLQEKRIAAIVAQQQDNIATRANAAHPNNLLSRSRSGICPLHAPISLYCWQVGFHKLAQTDG